MSLSREEVLSHLVTARNAVRRLPECDEKRTALPPIEALLAEAKQGFEKTADAEKAKVVAKPVVQPKIEKKIEPSVPAPEAEKVPEDETKTKTNGEVK